MQISQGNGRFNIALPYENSPTGERKYTERKRKKERGIDEEMGGAGRYCKRQKEKESVPGRGMEKI